MKSVIFLFPVTSQPRFYKRVRAFIALGYIEHIFSFERRYFKGDVDNISYISLGKVSHRKYLSRITKLFHAVNVLIANKTKFINAKCIYAFGLDMVFLSLIVKIIFRISVPIIYEIGDVVPIMLINKLKSNIFRWLERTLIKKVFLVVTVTSGIKDDYLVKRQNISGDKIFILENKLYPPIPEPKERKYWKGNRALVIGFFGLLDSQKTWDFLYNMAKSNPKKIKIYIKGYNFNLKNFEKRNNELDNIIYEGEYVSPSDLAEIYSKVDITMLDLDISNDYWAKPNRYFESIYYGVPMIESKEKWLAKNTKVKDYAWLIDGNNVKESIRKIINISPGKYKSKYDRIRSIQEEGLGVLDHKSLIQKIEQGVKQ